MKVESRVRVIARVAAVGSTTAACASTPRMRVDIVGSLVWEKNRKKLSLGFGTDDKSEVGNAVDTTSHLVTGPQWPDTGGRARVDQVTGRQRDRLGDVADDVSDRPDEITQIAFLLQRAIDLEPDAACLRMANRPHRLKRAAG